MCARDSTPRFVHRSVGWLVSWSYFTFFIHFNHIKSSEIIHFKSNQVILSQFRSLSVNLSHFSHFIHSRHFSDLRSIYVNLGHLKSIQVNLSHFRSFQVILSHFKSILVISVTQGIFVILGQFKSF